MPTYSYRCTVCANEFDVHQSFNDDPLEVCEFCGGRLRKLFNSVGIVFKGSGFYHNDSKSKASLGANAGRAAGSGESASSASSDSASPAPDSSSSPAAAGGASTPSPSSSSSATD